MTILPNWMTLSRNRRTAATSPLSTLPCLPVLTSKNDRFGVQRAAPARMDRSIGKQQTKLAPAPTTLSAKQRQLLNLLDMPNGIQASVLAARLGRKIPSVRAAVSRLRAAAHEIEALASTTSGEVIYRCRRQSVPLTVTAKV